MECVCVSAVRRAARWLFFTRLGRAILVLAAVFLILKFVARHAIVYGPSMEPTLHNGQLIVTDLITYRFREPRRGEIVFVKSNEDPPLYVVKRIVALPGETVAMAAGRLIINGKPRGEPWVTENPSWWMLPVILDASHYYIMGDNRHLAMEENFHHQVARRNIIGRVPAIFTHPGERGP